MSKKNLLKLSLDLCMVITLALMYNKSSINMTFHEIGGLALIGVFLIHVLLNGKWVTVVTKKLFSKTLPVKTRIGYIVNILLLISFLLIGISGIFISEVLFHISSNGGFSWKMIHYTSAAIALILVGVHLGLHKQFITSHLSKLIPLPKIVGRIIGILLTVIIFAFGCYSMVTTSFLSWISMPFSSGQMAGGFEGGRPSGMEDGFDKNSQNRPDMPSEDDKNTSGDTAFPSGTPSASADDTASDATSDDMLSRPSEDFAGGDRMMGREGVSFSFLNLLKTISQYFSIAYLFATITGLLVLLLHKIIKKNIPPESTENYENSVNSGTESIKVSEITDTSEN